MKYFEFPVFGTTYLGQFQIGQYAAGKNLAVLITGHEKGKAEEGDEPLCYLSVNMVQEPVLPPDVFYAKGWSENEGIPEALQKLGLIEPALEISSALSGHVCAYAYRLTDLGRTYVNDPNNVLPEAPKAAKDVPENVYDFSERLAELAPRCKPDTRVVVKDADGRLVDLGDKVVWAGTLSASGEFTPVHDKDLHGHEGPLVIMLQ